MADSSTGGYIQPTDTIIPSTNIDDIIHDFLVGITGLANTLVRPMWQPEPPPTPDIDIDWLAFGISAQRHDYNAYIKNNLQRHEELEILCVCYGPDCRRYAGLIRDGIEVSQNRESLYQYGFGVVGCSDILRLAELINERYVDRCDTILTLRNEVNRTFDILDIVDVAGQIIPENKDSIEWTTEE